MAYFAQAPHLYADRTFDRELGQGVVVLRVDVV